MTEQIEMFADPEVSMDSPKVKWLKKHNVSTRYRKDLVDDVIRKIDPWEAWVGDLDGAIDDLAENGDWTNRIAFGATEMEAIARLADSNGWILWHNQVEPL